MNEDVKAKFLAELGQLAQTHPEGSEEYLHRIWTDWNRAQVYREAGLPVGESNLDPSALEALEANRHLVQRLEGRRWSVIAKARAQGASWQQIADALGVTRQSAHAAYRDALERMKRQGQGVSEQQLAEAAVHLRYYGSAAFASLFVSMLREEGVEVEWTPPEEQRDLESVVEGIVVAIAAHGAITAIETVVARFRKRFPRARIEVEDDD